jgi:hypothetical protein
MTWFKVDDRFYSHPKVLAISLAARGLWVSAGAWSSDHSTGGVVPDNALAILGGTPKLADELVTAGLWRRIRGAYRFHDWDRYQPDAMAEKDRKSSAGTIGNHRRWHEKRGIQDPNCAHCQGKPPDRKRSHVRSDSDRSSDSVANRPVPEPINTSVVSHLTTRSARGSDDDDMISQVVSAFLGRTEHLISGEEAGAIAAKVLGRAGARVANRAAYVVAAIAKETDPWSLLGEPPPLGEILHGTAEPSRSPWCGSCDERTRLLEDDQGRPYRCPECHPKAEAS